MIQLTRLNGQPLVLNSDLIKLIENAPDTVVTLVNGEKIIVRDTASQILERIIDFRRRVLDGLQMTLPGWAAGQPEIAGVRFKALPAEEA
jgi:flagellar protein FlbD